MAVPASSSRNRLNWLLRSWQNIPTPGWTAAIYTAVGCSFTMMGALMHVTTQEIVELKHEYSDLEVDSNGVGFFDFEVHQDMRPPIWVYYELDGYHQNHRRYIESRADVQLHDPLWSKTDSEPESCSPWVKTDGRVNYPCGLVAGSVFNDSFALVVRRPNEGSTFERLEVDSSSETIAWADDVSMFTNMDPEASTTGRAGVKNEHALNMWILNLFPPVECYQVNLGEKPWVPVSVATRKEQGPDGNEVEVLDCRSYFGKPTCNFVREGKPFTCEGDYQVREVKDWGVTSGHLLVWMRTAAFLKFRKIWGRVDSEIPAGSRLRVFAKDNFPVREHFGHKAFIMANTSIFGGRHELLAYAYLTVGAASLLFVSVFQCSYVIFKPSEKGRVGPVG